MSKVKIVTFSLRKKILGYYSDTKKVPKSSEILSEYLKQRKFPTWTAFYVAQCDVENDLWGKSHFNFEVQKKPKSCESENYHILRTGAFPFIKFHCSLRPKQGW
jgi:hypothetical protein